METVLAVWPRLHDDADTPRLHLRGELNCRSEILTDINRQPFFIRVAFERSYDNTKLPVMFQASPGRLGKRGNWKDDCRLCLFQALVEEQHLRCPQEHHLTKSTRRIGKNQQSSKNAFL